MSEIRIITLTVMLLLIIRPATAQVEDTTQKDIVDVTKDLFKNKTHKKSADTAIHGRKVLYAFLPGVGYKLVTKVTAVASLNASFYLGKREDTFLSSVTTYSEYSILNHQIIIPIVANIWAKENKYNWLGDFRYYKYPTYTYGLGGQSTLANADKVSYSYYRFYLECLKRIKSDFYAGVGYNMDYHTNISDQGIGDFQSYNNNATKTVSSGVSVHLKFDTRKNVNNPAAGNYYASLIYRSNFTFLGSDQNWQSVILDFRKYIKLRPHSKNVLAIWSYNWFTFGGKVPYFDLPATGWDTYSNLGREYIQGRLRGSNLLYLETEYRFGITHNGLLGGVVFANAQSVTDYPSNKFETIFPGTGIGLRIKVNTISKANFGIDYGVGRDRSQGFFFHICEVF